MLVLGFIEGFSPGSSVFPFIKNLPFPNANSNRVEDSHENDQLRLMRPCFSVNREVKLDVYGKRQTAKIKLLPSVFSSLYSRIKIFEFAVNSKRHFSIFV